MAKLENYKGGIELISGLKQKNNAGFALMEANAIQTREDGTRLDAELEALLAKIETLTGGAGGVFSAATKDLFPAIGDVNYIYKDEDASLLYEWNPTLGTYEVLGPTGGGLSPDEKYILFGGNSNV